MVHSERPIMTQPSPLEVTLFALLLLSSLFVFWRRFGPVLATIRRSKVDADFHLQPTGPRIAKFVWEVLLQAKVIKERPLPGIAHAFVFWGFCAFALISAAHFGSGIGLTLLSRDSIFGQFYFAMAAFFAFAVLVSILGLAFRRFVLRPKWL